MNISMRKLGVKTEPLKASSLIEILARVIREEGDIEVVVSGHPGEKGANLTEDDIYVIVWDDNSKRLEFIL
mgnify:FL=1